MSDKLTATISVKFTPDDVKDLHALAESREMEVSEYIRYLVLADREDARRQFDALSRIFARGGAADKENRE